MGKEQSIPDRTKWNSHCALRRRRADPTRFRHHSFGAPIASMFLEQREPGAAKMQDGNMAKLRLTARCFLLPGLAALILSSMISASYLEKLSKMCDPQTIAGRHV